MKSAFTPGLVALAAATLLAGPAAAAEHEQQAEPSRLYLKIDGIPGESASAAHKGEIEIMSYSLGATQSGTGSAGGGAGTGKVTFSDFTFTKAADSASPLILKSVATGTHSKEVVLTAERGGGKPQPYLTVKLEDVLITGFTAPGTASDVGTTEKVSLDFGKITMTSRKPDGSSVSVCWDVKAARSC